MLCWQVDLIFGFILASYAKTHDPAKIAISLTLYASEMQTRCVEVDITAHLSDHQFGVFAKNRSHIVKIGVQLEA